jgi:hypothetical protein
MAKLRWRDGINFLLGFWIAASPWVAGVAETNTPYVVSSVVAGLLIVVLAAFEIDHPVQWEEWGTLVLGAWAAVSPYALGLAADLMLTTSVLLAGGIVTALSVWTLVAARKHDGGEHAHGH